MTSTSSVRSVVSSDRFAVSVEVFISFAVVSVEDCLGNSVVISPKVESSPDSLVVSWNSVLCVALEVVKSLSVLPHSFLGVEEYVGVVIAVVVTVFSQLQGGQRPVIQQPKVVLYLAPGGQYCCTYSSLYSPK